MELLLPWLVIIVLLLNISLSGKYRQGIDYLQITITVSHCGCNRYSLNQAKHFNLAPGNTDLNTVSVAMYGKDFRTEINATISRIKRRRNILYYGRRYLFSIDIEQPQITSFMELTPAQCKQASERETSAIFNHEITYEKSKQETHHKWKGDMNGRYVNEC